jgi:methylated-DNA-[protein]-cysteine S-methyltransferase
MEILRAWLKMKNVFFYDYPIGEIGIAEDNGAISRVVFRDSKKNFSSSVVAETPLIKKAAAQLAEYFAGKRVKFDLPLAPAGTEFQRSVWQALLTIPFGKTRSYGEIAVQIGNPKACRAVGMANNRNPIAIIIPCHRVIGRDGSLVGYGGGLDIKRYLLDLEKRRTDGDH